MSTTDIYIARHGETEYNRRGRLQGRGIDIPLNKTGRLQAKAIADALKDAAIDHIISSSLMRAMETAEIIAWSLRMQYNSYPELDEMNFGRFEGRSTTEIEQELDHIHQTWREGNTEMAMEEGESPAGVLKRVLPRLHSVLEKHRDTTILFVLHGRLIRILLSELLGYGLSEMHRIEHSNGALYHLKETEGNFEAVYLHKTDHLEGIEVGG